MHYPTAELLFPYGLIAELRALRGPRWEALVERVLAVEEAHPDSLAFMLMMIELGECLPCNSQSYKFLQGCQVCSARTVRCFKGTDEELLARFRNARARIEAELPAYVFLFAAARNGIGVRDIALE